MTEFFARKVVEYISKGAAEGAALPRADQSLKEWWAIGIYADQMLEVAELAEVPPRALVLAGCAIAETVVHLVPCNDEAPRMALLMARRWAREHSSNLNFEVAHRSCWDSHRTYPCESVGYRATYVIAMATAMPFHAPGKSARYSFAGASMAALHAQTLHADVSKFNAPPRFPDIVRKYISWEMLEEQLLKEPIWALKFG